MSSLYSQRLCVKSMVPWHGFGTRRASSNPGDVDSVVMFDEARWSGNRALFRAWGYTCLQNFVHHSEV